MLSGMLLIDKPVGYTSQDVCNKIKHMLHVKKVGHCGTLDPFASGLVIVLINKATKLLPFIMTYDKQYDAKLKLGIETDTLDNQGKIIKQEKIPILNNEKINEVFRSFIGESMQIPPVFSAIKINGKPAYDYARKGIDLQLKPRKINIYDLKLTNFSDDEISFSCLVSKGTYIRVLGKDIALKLNSVGHLTYLRRTKIGNYDIANSIKLEDVKQEEVIPVDKCLIDFPKYVVNDSDRFKIANGQPFFINNFNYDLIAIHDRNNVLLAIYKKDKDNDRYICLRGIDNGNN